MKTEKYRNVTWKGITSQRIKGVVNYNSAYGEPNTLRKIFGEKHIIREVRPVRGEHYINPANTYAGNSLAEVVNYVPPSTSTLVTGIQLMKLNLCDGDIKKTHFIKPLTKYGANDVDGQCIVSSCNLSSSGEAIAWVERDLVGAVGIYYTELKWGIPTGDPITMPRAQLKDIVGNILSVALGDYGKDMWVLSDAFSESTYTIHRYRKEPVYTDEITKPKDADDTENEQEESPPKKVLVGHQFVHENTVSIPKGNSSSLLPAPHLSADNVGNAYLTNVITKEGEKHIMLSVVSKGREDIERVYLSNLIPDEQYARITVVPKEDGSLLNILPENKLSADECTARCFMICRNHENKWELGSISSVSMATNGRSGIMIIPKKNHPVMRIIDFK